MKLLLNFEPFPKPDSVVGLRAWFLELRKVFQPLKNDFENSPSGTGMFASAHYEEETIYPDVGPIRLPPLSRSGHISQRVENSTAINWSFSHIVPADRKSVV